MIDMTQRRWVRALLLCLGLAAPGLGQFGEEPSTFLMGEASVTFAAGTTGPGEPSSAIFKTNQEAQTYGVSLTYDQLGLPAQPYNGFDFETVQVVAFSDSQDVISWIGDLTTQDALVARTIVCDISVTTTTTGVAGLNPLTCLNGNCFSDVNRWLYDSEDTATPIVMNSLLFPLPGTREIDSLAWGEVYPLCFVIDAVSARHYSMWYHENVMNLSGSDDTMFSEATIFVVTGPGEIAVPLLKAEHLGLFPTVVDTGTGATTYSPDKIAALSVDWVNYRIAFTLTHDSQTMISLHGTGPTEIRPEEILIYLPTSPIETQDPNLLIFPVIGSMMRIDLFDFFSSAPGPGQGPSQINALRLWDPGRASINQGAVVEYNSTMGDGVPIGGTGFQTMSVVNGTAHAARDFEQLYDAQGTGGFAQTVINPTDGPRTFVLRPAISCPGLNLSVPYPNSGAGGFVAFGWNNILGGLAGKRWPADGDAVVASGMTFPAIVGPAGVDNSQFLHSAVFLDTFAGTSWPFFSQVVASSPEFQVAPPPPAIWALNEDFCLTMVGAVPNYAMAPAIVELSNTLRVVFRRPSFVAEGIVKFQTGL